MPGKQFARIKADDRPPKTRATQNHDHRRDNTFFQRRISASLFSALFFRDRRERTRGRGARGEALS